MSAVLHQKTGRTGWFVGWRLGLVGLGAQIGLVVLVCLGLIVLKPGHLNILWQDPAGIKMSVAAGGMLLMGSVTYLGGCLLLGVLLARPERSLLFWLANGVFAFICFVLFILPAVYVALVGPAAIGIQQHLLAK